LSAPATTGHPPSTKAHTLDTQDSPTKAITDTVAVLLFLLVSTAVTFTKKSTVTQGFQNSGYSDISATKLLPSIISLISFKMNEFSQTKGIEHFKCFFIEISIQFYLELFILQNSTLEFQKTVLNYKIAS